MIDQTTAPYAALALRLTTGGLFLAHGLTKLLVFTIPGTVGFFESMGLPAILAYLTIIAEIGGGIALILGVATRLVSLAVLPVLLGAIWHILAPDGCSRTKVAAGNSRCSGPWHKLRWRFLETALSR